MYKNLNEEVVVRTPRQERVKTIEPEVTVLVDNGAEPEKGLFEQEPIECVEPLRRSQSFHEDNKELDQLIRLIRETAVH